MRLDEACFTLVVLNTLGGNSRNGTAPDGFWLGGIYSRIVEWSTRLQFYICHSSTAVEVVLNSC